MNAMDVALICKALGDANRLEIVQMLSDGEKCGCKLLERFEITQPTLSHDEFSGNIVANSYENFFGLRCRFGRHRAEVHRTSCALVFSLIRVRKHWWDDITQGKQ